MGLIYPNLETMLEASIRKLTVPPSLFTLLSLRYLDAAEPAMNSPGQGAALPFAGNRRLDFQRSGYGSESGYGFGIEA